MIGLRSAALVTLAAVVLAPRGTPAAARLETLRAIGGLPAHVVGVFEKPLGFQQTTGGRYFVFDRRAHAVYTVADGTVKKIVEIGAEPGRLLEPTAFDMDPHDGTFVVADAPAGQERIQTFTASGSRIAGFTLPGRELPRVTSDNFVMNGIGSLQFTGETVLVNQPERGALVTELRLDGTPVRTFGLLRPSGQEADRDVHLAFNIGLPLVDPTGGYYFVFAAGPPLFRKYDAAGKLLFERHVEGPEVDRYLAALPGTWPKRELPGGGVIPIVPPAVRTAGVDRQGRLWIALTQQVTYIYDPSGDKIRVVQFRGAGVLDPSSLFFTGDGRVLVTPGCYEFRVD
jgi:hypothetical protein